MSYTHNICVQAYDALYHDLIKTHEEVYALITKDILTEIEHVKLFEMETIHYGLLIDLFINLKEFEKKLHQIHDGLKKFGLINTIETHRVQQFPLFEKNYQVQLKKYPKQLHQILQIYKKFPQDFFDNLEQNEALYNIIPHKEFRNMCKTLVKHLQTFESLRKVIEVQTPQEQEIFPSKKISVRRN